MTAPAPFRFVGVDWGTSSFRAWLCPRSGQPRVIHRSDRGMSRLTPPEFAPYLKNVLQGAGIPTCTPVVICGMAGARDGWCEVPYVTAPAARHDIARQAIPVSAGAYAGVILPGICLSGDGRYDVMRGEETLLFGALALGGQDGLYCLPGTHSKWCRITSGELVSWQTVMTGEMFELLTSRSTLAGFCGATPPRPHTRPAFERAVREMIDGRGSALHRLFSIRARALLDDTADRRDFPCRLSGLLIGQEIAGLALDRSQAVSLIASGTVCDAYQIALGIAGHDVVVIDAEAAALAGLTAFAATLLGKMARRSLLGPNSARL